MVTPRSTATWPSSGRSSPVIIRNSVVLPAPFGPTRPTFSPLLSAAEASMKRSWWPFCLLMLSRRIMCVGDLENTGLKGSGALMPCGAPLIKLSVQYDVERVTLGEIGWLPVVEHAGKGLGRHGPFPCLITLEDLLLFGLAIDDADLGAIIGEQVDEPATPVAAQVRRVP